MFDKKLKVEKVELVKQFIRANNYQDYERTHLMCVQAGINVNRPALDRFAEKPALLDSAERQKQVQQHKANTVSYGSSLHSQAVHLNSMSHDQLKKREYEITFELGALKIRENQLLTELSTLSDRLENKH